MLLLTPSVLVAILFLIPLFVAVLILTAPPFAALFPSFLESAVGTYGLCCRQTLRPRFLAPYRPAKAFTLHHPRHLDSLEDPTVPKLHSD